MRPTSFSPARGVHVRVGRVDPLPPAEAALRETLGADLARARGLHGARRRQFLSARAWARRIVTGDLGHAWHGFEQTPPGVKPRLRRSRADVGIAHTGDRLAVAVTERGRIGIDIETAAAVFDQPALLRRMCTPEERRHAATLAPAARRVWMVRAWAVKESYAKALGVGLALDFAAIAASDVARQPPVRRVWTWQLGEGTVLAATWLNGSL